MTNKKTMANATIIGSGPNGLAAAITVAAAGIATTVYERNDLIGGGCSTAEITLPGFRHDLGSSVYPMGIASPFFRSLPIEIPWIQPDAPCAHPLDDGTAVMLERSVERTADGLDAADRARYVRTYQGLAEEFEELAVNILQPLLRVPRSPWLMARFGLGALLPGAVEARRYEGPRGRALFAGMAAHSVLSLEVPASAAVGLTLMAAGHAVGWPIVRGGAQTLSDALAGHLRSLGGRIETSHEVTALDSGSDVTLADVTPRQLLRIAGGALPDGYRRQLEDFKYGAGAFKVDYALSEPIPWTAAECRRAATVHVCGSFEDVVASERTFTSDRPFVLLVQPSLFDATRAPKGKHTAWAYCHVPNGSAVDRLADIERQIERFAPGFAECVLARAVHGPAALEQWNPNLVGGDFSGGGMSLAQLAFRPTPSLYRTPVKGLFLCGASTPPGGGVHGMNGFHAASAALRFLGA
jgi:phytoene dehydrogenase-like protein